MVVIFAHIIMFHAFISSLELIDSLHDINHAIFFLGKQSFINNAISGWIKKGRTQWEHFLLYFYAIVKLTLKLK